MVLWVRKCYFNLTLNNFVQTIQFSSHLINTIMPLAKGFNFKYLYTYKPFLINHSRPETSCALVVLSLIE